jgi:Na+/H+ antiporter NhaD/arsenite permease-like protein
MHMPLCNVTHPVRIVSFNLHFFVHFSTLFIAYFLSLLSLPAVVPIIFLDRVSQSSEKEQRKSMHLTLSLKRCIELHFPDERERKFA